MWDVRPAGRDDRHADKIDQVDERTITLVRRLDALDHRLERFEVAVDSRFEKVDARFGKLEAQVGNLIDWKHRVAGVLIASTGLMAMVGFLADFIPRWIGAIGH
jgi:hypothetical protein